MSVIETKDKVKDNQTTSGGGNKANNNNQGYGGGGDGDKGGKGGGKIEPKKVTNSPMLFVLFAMIPITIFFGAIVFVYIYREISNGWQPIKMPPAAVSSTIVLIISSITLEIARKALKNKQLERFKRWIMISTFFGIAFFTSQLVAWKQLMAKGVYMASTNPHANFFYMLTGVHAVHLFGGLIGLFYVLLGAIYYRFSADRRNAVDVATTYWHFMDGIWIFLFLLLFVWK
jgi:cytochrome c oxidase subunit 3